MTRSGLPISRQWGARCCLVSGILAACSLAAFAQAVLAPSKYESVEDIAADLFIGNSATGPKKMSGNVHMKFVGALESDTMEVSADTVNFEYADKSSRTPSRIVLEGNVKLKNAQGNVAADRGDIDFTSNEVVFSGDCTLDSEQMQGAKLTRLTLNIETQDFVFEGMTAKKMVLGGQGTSAASQGLLAEADVRDWPGFLTKLKADAAAPSPSPGKHMLSLLDETVSAALANAAVDALVKQKAAILKQVNSVLSSPKLYNEAAWAGKTIESKAKELQKAGAKGAELVWMNRSLLSTAYPDFIAPPAPLEAQ